MSFNITSEKLLELMLNGFSSVYVANNNNINKSLLDKYHTCNATLHTSVINFMYSTKRFTLQFETV